MRRVAALLDGKGEPRDPSERRMLAATAALRSLPGPRLNDQVRAEIRAALMATRTPAHGVTAGSPESRSASPASPSADQDTSAATFSETAGDAAGQPATDETFAPTEPTGSSADAADSDGTE